MGDNVNITAGSGTTIASDEVTIGGANVQVQRVKIALGTDGNYQADLANGQATAANSLPVVLPATQDATLADDAAFTAATSRVMTIGGVYQETPDEVNDGDVGAPRITIRRALMNAPDQKLLTLTSGTPVPTGSDIVNNSGSAIASGDLEIRDGSIHYFRVPMYPQYRNLTIYLAMSPTFDQTMTIALDAIDCTIMSGTLGTTVAKQFIGFGAAGTGAATAFANGGYINVAALQNPITYFRFWVYFGTPPSAGNLSITFARTA